MRLVLTWVAVLALTGCEADLGACDPEAARAIYYDESGYPAYAGQALMDVSCGAGRYCHSQGIPPVDRFGAPAGLNLDVAIAFEADQVDRLREALRVARDLRHGVYAHVSGGTMPPSGPDAELALAEGVSYRAHIGAAEERALPDIRSEEGQALLRNWLACDAPAVEAVEGPSRGVGDIVALGPVSSSCPEGQRDCGAGCVALATDAGHCGACGVTCGASQSCQEGACRCINGDLDACGAECVDLQTSNSNCGACGDGCDGRFCADGACLDACPASTTDCGGSCVDTSRSAMHCGRCDEACRADQVCAESTCACRVGTRACGDACVDVSTSAAHCGACDNACADGAGCEGGSCTCGSGLIECGGACVDVMSDPSHCGGCSMPCGAGAGCNGGVCQSCGPEVGFAANILPIFAARCALSGCHQGARPTASLDLTAGRAWGELVGVAASCGSSPLVTPGDVERSYLWDKLIGNECSGTQMPKRGELLPAAELDLIRSWVCRGAADD